MLFRYSMMLLGFVGFRRSTLPFFHNEKSSRAISASFNSGYFSLIFSTSSLTLTLFLVSIILLISSRIETLLGLDIFHHPGHTPVKIKYNHIISCIIMILMLATAAVAVGLNDSSFVFQSNNYLPKELVNVYIRLYKIENMNPLIRPNTSIPVRLLKEALTYIKSNTTYALNLIKEANESIDSVVLSYNSMMTVMYIKVAVITLIIVSFVIVYKRFLRDKIFLYWLKLRGNNIVVKGDGKPKSILFSREAIAVILAVLTITSIIVAVETFRPLISEHYSQLGIIGEKGVLGNYNIIHPVGDNVTFKVFVGNMLGYTALYNVRIYLVINNSTEELLLSRYLILANKENTTVPFTIRVNVTGSQNIVVELWVYDPNADDFVYSGRKVNIWIKGVKV